MWQLGDQTKALEMELSLLLETGFWYLHETAVAS